jgi:hypothetical protein
MIYLKYLKSGSSKSLIQHQLIQSRRFAPDAELQFRIVIVGSAVILKSVRLPRVHENDFNRFVLVPHVERFY